MASNEQWQNIWQQREDSVRPGLSEGTSHSLLCKKKCYYQDVLIESQSRSKVQTQTMCAAISPSLPRVWVWQVAAAVSYANRSLFVVRIAAPISFDRILPPNY